jgi:hypothetical protein
MGLETRRESLQVGSAGLRREVQVMRFRSSRVDPGRVVVAVIISSVWVEARTKDPDGPSLVPLRNHSANDAVPLGDLEN